jgi:hypothetical protein
MIKIMVVVLVGMMAGSAAASELTTEQKQTCNSMQNAGALIARSLSQYSKQDVQASINKEPNAFYREVNTNILVNMKSTNVYDLEKLSQHECAKAVVKYTPEQRTIKTPTVEEMRAEQMAKDKEIRYDPKSYKPSKSAHELEMEASVAASNKREADKKALEDSKPKSKQEIYMACIKALPRTEPAHSDGVAQCREQAK